MIKAIRDILTNAIFGLGACLCVN